MPDRSLIAVISASVDRSTLFAGQAFARGFALGLRSVGEAVVFTYADVSEPSSLNPMVGYLATDYTMWALAYDIPINFATKDFSPDYDHSTRDERGYQRRRHVVHVPLPHGRRSGPTASRSPRKTPRGRTPTTRRTTPNYSADLALMDTAVATDDTTMADEHEPYVVLLRRVRLPLRLHLAQAHMGEVRGRLQGRETRDGVPVRGHGPVHHHRLREEPVRAAGPQPELLGQRGRDAPAHRPDHLAPHLRQPGRGQRPPCSRARSTSARSRPRTS